MTRLILVLTLAMLACTEPVKVVSTVTPTITVTAPPSGGNAPTIQGLPTPWR